MANYRRGTFDLTVDSNFQPFSFQEMLAPLAIYDRAYGEMEEDFLKQQKEVDTLKYLADTLPEKSEAREIYDSYVNDLQDALSDFGNSKLNPITANKLLNLKRRSGDLIKLKQIATIRDNQIKAQDAALAKDPTLILSRDARDTSFDEYMENPDMGYKSYSGALIASQVADATSQLSKELTDLIQNKPTPALTSLEQYYGLRAKDVAFALRHPNSTQANDLLKLILANVIEASGIAEWGNPDALKSAYDWGTTSFWKAIGQSRASGYNMPRAYSAVPKVKKAESSSGDILIAPNMPLTLETSPQSGSTTHAVKKVASTKETLRYKDRRTNKNRKGFGGNLFAAGGNTTEENTEDNSSKDFFQEQVNRLSDSEYNAFMDSLVKGMSNPTEADIDKAFEAYRKQYNADYQKALSTNAYYKIREQYDRKFPNQQVELGRTPIFTQDERDGNAYNNYSQIQNLKQYLQKTKNGHWVLNKEGQRKYNSTGDKLPLLFGFSGRNPWMTPAEAQADPLTYIINRYHLQPLARGEAGPNQDRVINELLKQQENLYDSWEMGQYDASLPNSALPDLSSMLDVSNIISEDKIPNLEIVRDPKTHKPMVQENFVKVSPKSSNGSSVKAYTATSATVHLAPIGNYVEARINGERVKIPYRLINKGADEAAKTLLNTAALLNKKYKPGTIIQDPENLSQPIVVDQLIGRYIIDAKKQLLLGLRPYDPEDVKASKIAQ